MRKRTLQIVKILKKYESANLRNLDAKFAIAEEIVEKLNKDFKMERGL